jgi:hypothetical protein
VGEQFLKNSEHPIKGLDIFGNLLAKNETLARIKRNAVDHEYLFNARRYKLFLANPVPLILLRGQWRGIQGMPSTVPRKRAGQLKP